MSLRLCSRAPETTRSSRFALTSPSLVERTDVPGRLSPRPRRTPRRGARTGRRGRSSLRGNGRSRRAGCRSRPCSAPPGARLQGRSRRRRARQPAQVRQGARVPARFLGLLADLGSSRLRRLQNRPNLLGGDGGKRFAAGAHRAAQLLDLVRHPAQVGVDGLLLVATTTDREVRLLDALAVKGHGDRRALSQPTGAPSAIAWSSSRFKSRISSRSFAAYSNRSSSAAWSISSSSPTIIFSISSADIASAGLLRRLRERGTFDSAWRNSAMSEMPLTIVSGVMPRCSLYRRW